MEEKTSEAEEVNRKANEILLEAHKENRPISKTEAIREAKAMVQFKKKFKD
jgi:hypothetical protein